MIKSLSPYYVTTPFLSPLTGAISSEYKLQVFIWDGLKASVPVLPEYEITKPNLATSFGNDKIDIARLVNDFVDFLPISMANTGVFDGENQIWVKTQVIYTTIDSLDDGVVQLEDVNLMVKGYSYGMDGENADVPTNKILLSGVEFKVNEDGFFNLPILVSETTTYQVTIKSYPTNFLNYSTTIAATTDSSELVKNVYVDVSDAVDENYIEITFNSQTITLLITNECRYTPVNIEFQNKEGALQILTFFKARTDSLSVSNEDYESNYNQPKFGYHQYLKYNVQAKSKFKISSGFVSESLNETFKQLFLSERVWHLENGVHIPINLSSKNFEYKTRQKDRLINYELEFDFAYNEINNV